MKMNQKSRQSIKVSNDMIITPRKKEKAYTISYSDWEFLEKKVDKIYTPSLGWEKFGWLLLGIGISQIVTAIMCKSLWLWIAIFSLVVIGCVIIYFTSRERKIASCSKKDVLDEMKRIKEKHQEQNVVIEEHNDQPDDSADDGPEPW